MRLSIISPVIVCAALAATSHAVIIAEDSFLVGPGDYDTGSSLFGQGPAATGFTGDWISATGTGINPIATGLSYGDLVTSGGAIQTNAGNVRGGRLLSSPVTSATTGTLYLSFLMDLPSVDGQYKALELHSGGFNDGANRNFRLGNGGGSNGFSNDNFGARVAGGTLADLGAGDTATNLFVVRFDLSDQPASDTVTIYRNPTDLTAEPALATATLSGQDILFDRISVAMFTGVEVTYDEIRLGTTYNSVTPIPEPASLAFGLVGLLAVRRRR
ncbi:MAG: hypothetical protein ACFCVE_05500 [Phycisphaerae bacterium]